MPRKSKLFLQYEASQAAKSKQSVPAPMPLPVPSSSQSRVNPQIQMALQASRKDLISFCIAMNRDYKVNWHHDLIGSKLMKVESGEIKKLIIEMPPRAGKSLLSSIYFPAWFLGKNPKRQVILASYSGELAVDFGFQCREVMEEKLYKAIFPAAQLHAAAASKDKWMTTEGGRYVSVGVGGALSGRGADLLIIDDPTKDWEEANSETMRNKIWNWFTSVARTRLSPSGAIVVITTRWHIDDLVGRILETHGGEWERIRFPFIAEVADKYRKVGDALWPARFPADFVDELRKENEYIFQCLYQQNPIASELQEFKAEYFRYFEEAELSSKDLNYYVAIDPAISEKKGADNTGIVVVGKEASKPEWYVVEEESGKYDPLQLIDKLFALKGKYGRKLVKVGIEEVQYQKALEYFIKEEQKNRGDYFNIVPLKAVGKKVERIRGLLPMFKSGVIFMRKTMKALEGELLVFPGGKHDDRIDALAYMTQLVDGTRRGMIRRDNRHRLFSNSMVKNPYFT